MVDGKNKRQTREPHCTDRRKDAEITEVRGIRIVLKSEQVCYHMIDTHTPMMDRAPREAANVSDVYRGITHTRDNEQYVQTIAGRSLGLLRRT